MSLWLRPTLAFFFWVVCCPLRLRAATTVVQSTDAAIEYTGVWEVVMLNSSTAYAVSNVSGSKVVYTFTGTKISVFGVVLPRGSPNAAQVSEYSVDGSTPTQYTAPGNVTEATYNLQFFSSGISAQGQHTLTILNLGDEFIIGHFEVTSNPIHVNPTESDPGPTFTTTSREPNTTTTSTPSSTSTSFLSSSTIQSTSSRITSTNNGTLTSTNTSTIPSTLPSTTFTSTTTSILTTSSTSPPDSAPTQGHITTLSKGATIGGGIAGTLGFLLLVGGVCWWGQRRGRRRCQGSLGASNSTPTLGMHAATSQVTLGSDPFASERLRRGPPVYIPVGSASDLSNGGSQYTPTQGPSRAGYLSEKYGMDDAPLHSPVSTANLLDSPNYPHYALASPAPRFDTPMQVHRMDVDGRRRSADGGVRIAGGRPGQRVDAEDPDDSFLDLASRKSIGSTLPPAYDFD